MSDWQPLELFWLMETDGSASRIDYELQVQTDCGFQVFSCLLSPQSGKGRGLGVICHVSSILVIDIDLLPALEILSQVYAAVLCSSKVLLPPLRT